MLGITWNHSEGSRSRDRLVSLLVAVLSLSALASSLPVSATILEGRIETQSEQGAAPAEANVQPGGSAAPSQAEQSTPPGRSLMAPNVVARSTPPSGSFLTFKIPNSFPEAFRGRWQCVTKVVDSSVDSVSVGMEMASEVHFVKTPEGRVIGQWSQPGWTETQSSAVSWSPQEAQVDRTSYYFANGMNGAWASRSRDHFVQISPYKLECNSYVDQYLDGRYLGRYRTVSTLTRVETVNTIAQSGSGEK